MVTRLSDDIDHRLHIQGPFTHLGGKRRAIYIITVLRQVLDFFHV